MTPISSIQSPLSPLSAAPLGSSPLTRPDAAAGQPFKNILLEALDQVGSMQQQADQAVQQLVTGGDVNPAEVLTSLQKADMSFKLMLQIRNKLVQAYQEVNNIRI
jgi:flagellar hook-basal body complex protein FliE